MSNAFRLLLLLLGATFLVCPQARAEQAEVIWSGLVYASNDPNSQEENVELAPLAQEFKRLFGFRNYRLLGETTQKIQSGDEGWLVPSKQFFLKVTQKKAESGRRMRLVLFQEQKQVLDADVKLQRSSPLVIRGPEWGDGRVIIVLKYR